MGRWGGRDSPYTKDEGPGEKTRTISSNEWWKQPAKEGKSSAKEKPNKKEVEPLEGRYARKYL